MTCEEAKRKDGKIKPGLIPKSKTNRKEKNKRASAKEE